MEYCPSCRTVRNMRVSKFRDKQTDSNGNIKEILTKTYHCESCGSFVRCENTTDDKFNFADFNRVIQNGLEVKS